jgi:hypothetical protein
MTMWLTDRVDRLMAMHRRLNRPARAKIRGMSKRIRKRVEESRPAALLLAGPDI